MKELQLLTEGEKIDHLVNQVMQLINKHSLKPDGRGAWFSNKMLDSVRKILEKRGLRSAQIYLSGKLDPRENRYERSKHQILLNILKEVGTLRLDLIMASYVIGKLNFIINEQKTGVNS